LITFTKQFRNQQANNKMTADFVDDEFGFPTLSRTEFRQLIESNIETPDWHTIKTLYSIICPELETTFPDKKIYWVPMFALPEGICISHGERAESYIHENYAIVSANNIIIRIHFTIEDGSPVLDTTISVTCDCSHMNATDKLKLVNVLFDNLNGYVEWNGRNNSDIRIHYDSNPVHTRPETLETNDFYPILSVDVGEDDGDIDEVEYAALIHFINDSGLCQYMDADGRPKCYRFDNYIDGHVTILNYVRDNCEVLKVRDITVQYLAEGRIEERYIYSTDPDDLLEEDQYRGHDAPAYLLE
jgi:hypothetical protein